MGIHCGQIKSAWGLGLGLYETLSSWRLETWSPPIRAVLELPTLYQSVGGEATSDRVDWPEKVAKHVC